MWINHFILADSGAGQEVVEQVSDMIETASSTADTIVNRLPVLTTRLLMAALVIFIGCILLKVGRAMIGRVVRKRGTRGARTVQQVDTLRALVSSIFSYIVYFIIATLVLSVFGVDVTSILAVAGVGGIAISFGAQTLVKDIISGLFIWMEGSIAVGDVVSINGMDGTVESIAIRTTVLRNFNGNLFTIPNGDIRTITNMSRGFKRAIVDIRCPYEANQEALVKIIEEEMELAAREIDGVESKPDVMSILSFDTDAVLVRVAVACPVGENWRVEREIRTRIKARFDREGIVMPHYSTPRIKADS